MPSIEALEKLLKTDPADPFLLYGLAQEYANQKNHETAITYYDQCIAADPSYCYAYYHKARSQQELDLIDEAIQTLKTGSDQARKVGDGHAVSELQAFLLDLT
jgi:tetratricopeptide (TPR) repeat protein